jgi:hypothetical protein
MNENKYIPGVCNIGPQEINRRRRVGWIGLAVALLLFIILVGINVNPWWRLLIFFPATLSTSGFLQAHFHFCAGFARKGVFNFGDVGKMQEIHDKDSNTQDRQKGNKITIYAALTGIIVAFICVFI